MSFRAKSMFTPVRLTVVAIVVFIICMIIYPTAVFQASKTGVNAWWNIVFPALLPFFISSELLMNYGVIQFMGVLLEPVMRPLFNLPGAGSFVLAVGYTSGFPISASLTARLRKDRLCTRLEAERLMCFTNNASPLFMLVAVGVGMFNNPRLGIIIAMGHYAGNLLLGFLLRFYKSDDPEFKPAKLRRDSLFREAVAEMLKAYRANPRPFAQILGDAITSSVNKLLVIGGFVIIFSVIIKICTLTGLMAVVTSVLAIAAGPLGFTKPAVQSLGCGFFEITLGTKAAAEAAASLTQKVTAASVILGWSGISVLAQVSAMISETDLKMGLFILSRLFHAITAGIFSLLLLRSEVVQAWLSRPALTGQLYSQAASSWSATLLYYSRLCIYAILIWVLLALVIYVWHSFSIIRLRLK